MTKEFFFKKSAFIFLMLFISGCLYFVLGYHTVRQNFAELAAVFVAQFLIYFIVIHYFSKNYFTTLLLAGFIFRLLFLFSVPGLSDDVYRFIWDGRVAANDINPFAFLPSEIVRMPSMNGISAALFEKLNSPDYYSVYPPVLQGIFWLTAKLFPESVLTSMVFMRSFIILVEIGTAALLIAILQKLSLSKKGVLFYILNPMVIAELSGNIHIDGIMIFCLLLAFFLLLTNKWMISAVVLGIAIATKLIPVLFLPMLMYQLGWKKGSFYAFIAGVTTMLLFLLVFDLTAFQHIINSAGLFIQTFEFNASLYYVSRWIGTQLMGYNPIAFVGPLLLMIVTLVILFVSFYQKEKLNTSLFIKALCIITFWFLFATTVHPWYICLPVALSVLTPYRFPLIWSFTSVMSYAAYQFKPVKENLWLIAIGYSVVIFYAAWELNDLRRRTNVLPHDS